MHGDGHTEATPPNEAVAAAVREGLSATPRRLAPWLFYDDEGSRLYERITDLPEYYLTRAEREIFERHGGDIIDAVIDGSGDPLKVVELGAGTASKSQILLRSVVERQGETVFVPVDVSPSAVAVGEERLRRELPAVRVQPVLGSYERAWPEVSKLGPRRLVLFIGSSVGNLSDVEARALFASVRRSVAAGGAMLLGTDLRKEPETLLPAYDDASGVTAAFNRNVLARINRDLGADFDLSRWRHEARWNDRESRVEMHLVSVGAQRARVPGVGAFEFGDGESIHTESSVKYDDARVEAIVTPAGWRRERRWTDAGGRFAVHLLRAV
ncbi:MAG: L-histidine N(alpha)-methyltransferase [Polyangiales bacterium]